MQHRQHIRVCGAAAVLLNITGCVTSEVPAVRFANETDFETSADSGEPYLHATSDGQLLLSWLERTETGHALKVAARVDGRWSDAKTAYASDRMFVNWADFPSIAATTDGVWMVHWLERIEGGTYAYHTRMSTSADKGNTWTEPATVHTDLSPTEHGFLSMTPMRDGWMDMIWLDGRQTGINGAGAMQVRGTSVHPSGARGPETVVDDRVCDCCQTALARTDRGLVAAYRDRSENEIRDIAVRTNTDGTWSEPIHVGDDHWHITGCPVNGPSLATSGDTVAIAWFTAPEREGRVQVAFSFDGGQSFGTGVRVDDGAPLGRVDVQLLSEGSALVTWLERDGEDALIRMRTIPTEGSPGPTQTLARTTQARQSGFPRSALLGDQVFIAHRAMDEEIGRVRVLVGTIDR